MLEALEEVAQKIGSDARAVPWASYCTPEGFLEQPKLTLSRKSMFALEIRHFHDC